MGTYIELALPALLACLPCWPACLIGLPALLACLPCWPACLVGLPASLACLPCWPACLVGLPALLACLTLLACLPCWPACLYGLPALLAPATSVLISLKWIFSKLIFLEQSTYLRYLWHSVCVKLITCVDTSLFLANKCFFLGFLAALISGDIFVCLLTLPKNFVHSLYHLFCVVWSLLSTFFANYYLGMIIRAWV